MLKFLIDNIFVTVWWVHTVYSQTCSFFRMRQTSCRGFSKKTKDMLDLYFIFMLRYIDDVLSLLRAKFGVFIYIIYSIELEIKDTTDILYTLTKI